MTYRVPVRELCEFAAKVGDLDLRFTPAPTAQDGIAGHQTVTGRRGGDYEREVPLSHTVGVLTVRGRADGYDPAPNRLEEIKTHRGDLSRQADNQRQLHWAQLMTYGAMLCAERKLSDVHLRLVYFDIGTAREIHLDRHCTAAELETHLRVLCERFTAWAVSELAHREARDRYLSALRFPHADFRYGQRALAEAVYKAGSVGCSLMVEAPTGIGKTLGTLFPQLKALAARQLDRVFFLAAKTPGRALALGALGHLRSVDAPLRVLELASREKTCEYPDRACHGESCPLAKGFYDRLPAARAEAAAHAWLDRPSLRDIALRHDVCPYYLGQELARWADVVVGDYNYYFDLGAMLHGLATANGWRALVLVDEAHNLVDRGRGMYSASLTQRSLDDARRSAPNAAVKRALDRVARQWRPLVAAQGDEPYKSYPKIPEALVSTLLQSVSELTDFLVELPAPLPTDVQRFYFDAMQFCRIAELFNEDYLFDLEKSGSGRKATSVLCLRNLSPAAFLAPRFAQSHSTVLFSATLSPARYYRDLLGLPGTTPWQDVPSPFKAGQLRVRHVGDVSTRYADRSASVAPIVEVIARQYADRPGNYLAFFSSFDYLQQIAQAFAQARPDVPIWCQSRQMNESEREGFLERFDPQGRGIGFAVLGGAFGEGVDLPGDRLIGAFIATLGLPQFNPVNERLKARMATAFGAGYEYAYLYPGLQKVVQAAGRVVRTLEDTGVVTLIDDRFGQRQVRELLPAWWPAPERIRALHNSAGIAEVEGSNTPDWTLT